MEKAQCNYKIIIREKIKRTLQGLRLTDIGELIYRDDHVFAGTVYGSTFAELVGRKVGFLGDSRPITAGWNSYYHV